MTDICFPQPIDREGLHRIAPTDVSQFIRLEQCERYLRLRLHERVFGQRFVRDYGVTPQSIPALLTRSGSGFEHRTEAQIRQHIPGARNFALQYAESGARPSDNDRLIAIVNALAPGDVTVVFQARLEAVVHGWYMRGDVDILRMARDDAGQLQVMVADMKSSRVAKVEHRLQVAFYHEMLASLFESHAIAHGDITMAVLYRGPSGDEQADKAERAKRERERAQAERYFGVTDSLLEIVERPDDYLGSVADLVTGEHSTARRVGTMPFEEVPFHLTYKCDGCIYNEFCMKWCAEHDDLSLIPHLTAQDKSALRRHGVTTTKRLAQLKEPVPSNGQDLAVSHGHETLVRRLAATWPVGPRLDEIVHRARYYQRWKTGAIDAIAWIPNKGYGSLPYSDEQHNPNLVRIYIDAQHDYLHDRVYLLGARIVASENGREPEYRQRSIVRMTDGPPDSHEREEALFIDWLREVLLELAEVAPPNPDGELKAPIHLIFYDDLQQQILLDGLSRQFTSVVEATPLYDFITQLAAFDSPIVTFLEREIRDHKNYPMVCQSLQSVAAYLKFDWNTPERYRELFRTRMFDFWGKLERAAGDQWYTNRARFNSFIPLEYAYAAWGDLDVPDDADRDEYRRFQGVTAEHIVGFQRRRLEALEHIAKQFRGNKQTVKREFDIRGMADFVDRARNLADALHEFIMIERHVDLAAWKSIRLAPPERRVLSGETLIVSYHEDDQEPGAAEQNRENARRRALREQYYAEYRRMHPDAKQVRLPPEQKAAANWDQDGLKLWLRIEPDGIGCDLDELLGLMTFREGDWLVLFTRWTNDTRLPAAERVAFTPTPRQMLWGMRVELKRMRVDRDPDGKATSALVEVAIIGQRGTGNPGFVFSTIADHYRPLEPGCLYTLDTDPNDRYASYALDVIEGLRAGGANTLFDRLTQPTAAASWPEPAERGQERFLSGLDALHVTGTLHDFETSKRDYIGGNGDASILVVQGPPGTGKSYTTAFAVFARLQGAMAAGIPLRVIVSCKTHAATDVLLDNVRDALHQLACWRQEEPAIFAAFFDARLPEIPIFRIDPREDVADPIIPLPRKRDAEKGQSLAVETVDGATWSVIGATPGGIRGAIHDKWGKDLFGHHFCDLLVLDEASQMSLPEAMMATLPLKRDGQMIVVGDHRQMPPIIKHDWANEPRRTFQEYRSYQSLFETLLARDPDMIQFERSFRLHADMAEFLRREIYQHDGIRFHSLQQRTLPVVDNDDPFVAATLAAEHPLVVVVHDEMRSQLRNLFEQQLIAPVLEALANLGVDGLDAREGLGVVVPHRAQRAALQDAVPCLSIIDPDTGAILLSAVDTVERFQGDERDAILVSATESDPQYLLASSQFLLDPRRLTVALSRAKHKMILVASRSVFNVFSADEETFGNAQLWKNLLRHTCTVPLWTGERHGQMVEVWGNERASVRPPGDGPGLNVTLAAASRE